MKKDRWVRGPGRSAAAGPSAHTARPPPAAPAGGSAADPEAPLPLAVKIAYGAPSLAGAGMGLLIAIHLTKFYADVVVVPLAHIAVAIALARAFDAITDPIMGWISDRTRTRYGRRRPYIALGAPLCAACFYLLFSPPGWLSPLSAAGWLTATFLLFFLFDTVCVVPHNALGPELTPGYHERSRLFGWRAAFTVLGTLIAAPLPGLLESRLGDPELAFRAMAAFLALLFVAGYALLVAVVREAPHHPGRRPNPLVPGVRRALRNRPFRILLAVYAIFALGGAMPGLLLPFMNAYVIRPGNEALFLAAGLTLYVGVGFLCIPLWVRLSQRVGKRGAWLQAMAVGIVANAGAWWLGEGDVAPALALLALGGSQFGAGFVLAPSIQADAIDYDELLTGRRREAQYGAFWSIVPKLVAIPAAAIPVAILDALGYVPNQPQTEPVQTAIRVLFALVPAAFAGLGFLMAWRFPITEAVHRRILEGIARHRAGRTVRDPLTGRTLPPPGESEVPEELGWFLDHFSGRELVRAVETGCRSAVRDAWRAVILSAGSLAVLALAAARDISRTGEDPSLWAAPLVAGAGLALTALAFHALRVGPAHRLRRAPPPAEVIRAHLRTLRRDAA